MFIKQRSQCRPVAIDNDHTRTGGKHRFGGRQSDARCAAGDSGHLTVELPCYLFTDPDANDNQVAR